MCIYAHIFHSEQMATTHRFPWRRHREETDLSEASCGRWDCSSACRTERRTSPGCRPAPPAWAGSSSPSRRSSRRRKGSAATFLHSRWEHTWTERWNESTRLFVGANMTLLHNNRGCLMLLVQQMFMFTTSGPPGIESRISFVIICFNQSQTWDVSEVEGVKKRKNHSLLQYSVIFGHVKAKIKPVFL